MDSLYTCSILAINATTGQLKWHYQVVPNDNWDYDAVQQLMLAEITVNGKPRKVIMQAPKDGFFYILDRATGQFISGTPFVQVNWAKGFDEKGRPMVNPEAFYGKDPITIYPTAGGAHNWAPMSYNPSTGLIYLPASQGSYTFLAADEVRGFPFGHPGVAFPGPGVKPRVPPIIGPDPLPNTRGVLEAWDPVSQKLVWRKPGGGASGGGTLTTAGNLVFQVLNDGRLLAYSADNGDQLLEIRTNRNGAAPPITYTVDGKQYVAFLAGTGRPPQAEGPTDAKVDNPPTLFVFELGGTAALPPPPPPGARGSRGAAPPPPPPAQELHK
jgi:quinohemoprotein ethanol dehydrogenase